MSIQDFEAVEARGICLIDINDAAEMRFIPIRIKFFICAGNKVHIQDIYRLIGCLRLIMSNAWVCRIGGTVVER